jgi:hypothetical protein
VFTWEKYFFLVSCPKGQVKKGVNPYYAALKLHDMAAAAAFFVCFA